MPRNRHKPEEIFAKLRQVDILVSQGKSIADAVRAIGVNEVTYYRWRQEFGGLKSDQVKRIKELEAENARLRRGVSDLTLDKMILALVVVTAERSLIANARRPKSATRPHFGHCPYSKPRPRSGHERGRAR